MKKYAPSHLSLIVFLLATSGFVFAESPIKVKGGPLDKVTLHTGTIDRSAPIHIHLFDTGDAKMGKAKHQDTARMMAGTVPHLLAIDVVESLRDAGFSNVILEETVTATKEANANALSLQGKFSELNPGSQAVRAWVGFGAGKSKVCVEGRLLNSAGKSLGEFSDCRSGIGWGQSAGELESSSKSIGDSISTMLTRWSNGDYAN